MSQPDPMACQELVERVTEYLDDAMAPEDRGQLEWHLGICDGCDAYIEQVRETIIATSAEGPELIPPEVLERLLEVYRAYRAG